MRRSIWLLVVSFVLGCASGEGVAQDEPSKPDRPAKEAPRADAPKAKDKDKKPKDPRKYEATVLDRDRSVGEGAQPNKPFRVHNVVLFVPEVSLFGGGAGEEVKELSVKRGSAQVTVPFHRIEKLVVGKTQEDRLELTVHLKDVPAEEAKLLGTVKSSLELRGLLGSKNLETTVRLRDAQEVRLKVLSEK